MDTLRGGARQQVPEDFAELLRNLGETNIPLLNALLAASRSAGWSAPALAAAVGQRPPTISKRIERARSRDEDPAIAADLATIRIPKPEKINAMIGGKRLPPEKIEELKRMQPVASRVNGALPAGHPHRRIGQAYSAELHRLVDEEGYSPYYLSKVLAVSHRAIASRLERYGWRKPPPSVAGTPSGLYHNRKIGDPGQGAARISRPQRAELRALWAAYVANRRGSRKALASKLQDYLESGFTLANLAQTMSNENLRVRYTALQAALEGRRYPKAGS